MNYRIALRIGLAVLLSAQAAASVFAAPESGAMAAWQKEDQIAQQLIDPNPASAAEHLTKALQLLEAEKLDPKDPNLHQLLLYDIGDTIASLATINKNASVALAKSESSTVEKLFGPHSAYAFVAQVQEQSAISGKLDQAKIILMLGQMTPQAQSEARELQDLMIKHAFSVVQDKLKSLGALGK